MKVYKYCLKGTRKSEWLWLLPVKVEKEKTKVRQQQQTVWVKVVNTLCLLTLQLSEFLDLWSAIALCWTRILKSTAVTGDLTTARSSTPLMSPGTTDHVTPMWVSVRIQMEYLYHDGWMNAALLVCWLWAGEMMVSSDTCLSLVQSTIHTGHQSVYGVCVCVRACVHACVSECVCVWEHFGKKSNSAGTNTLSLSLWCPWCVCVVPNMSAQN